MQKDIPKFKAANVHNSCSTVSTHQKLSSNMHIYTEQMHVKTNKTSSKTKIEWEKGKVATGFRTDM